MSKELNIIEVLNSNVGTEYEATSPKRHKYNCVVVLDEGNKVLINSKNGTKIDLLNDFIINTKFIPLQNPVSFIEAIKARYEGKTIKVVLRNNERIYKDNSAGLIDQNGGYLTPLEILEGKWYIEEE